MDLERLNDFLLYCARCGYASLKEEEIKSEKDGSHSIKLVRDDYLFHDNYFGGEPFGGREVVFHKAKAVWMMVYYGEVKDRTLPSDLIYSVLRSALAEAPVEAPFRGPEKHLVEDFSYLNKWTGGICSFSGRERILRAGEEVYSASYAGGLVDISN